MLTIVGILIADMIIISISLLQNHLSGEATLQRLWAIFCYFMLESLLISLPECGINLQTRRDAGHSHGPICK